MRAEGQAHIDRIDAALALVRKFLDWDRALRRFDELNARVEDPKLWDNPKDAEAVMRERRRLEASIGAVNTISAEMENAVEYVELGEAEGDEATVREGLGALAALANRADADKVQALLAGEADANDAYLEINAGAGGNSGTRLSVELFKIQNNLQLEIIIYNGNGPTATAVVGGVVDMAFMDVSAFAGHLQSGRVKALAIAGENYEKAAELRDRIRALREEQEAGK